MTPDEKATSSSAPYPAEHLHGLCRRQRPESRNQPRSRHPPRVGRRRRARPEVKKQGIEVIRLPRCHVWRQTGRDHPWRDVLDVVCEGLHRWTPRTVRAAFVAWNEHHRRFEFAMRDLDECKRRRNRTEEKSSRKRWLCARERRHPRNNGCDRNASCARQTLQPELF